MESADGAILLFDVTNKQSFVNLVSDKDNSRQIKRSWMKELIFKAKDDKYPVMILGMQLHTYGMPSLSASKTLLIAVYSSYSQGHSQKKNCLVGPGPTLDLASCN